MNATTTGLLLRVNLRRATITRIVLRRLRLVLLTGILLAGALAYTAFTKAQATIVEAISHSDAAIMDLSAAEQALVKANDAAASSFKADTFALLGPGADYYDQISVAQVSLQHAAQVGTVSLIEVEGELNAYVAQVDQANADHGSGAVALGSVEIKNYASALMNAGGILASLKRLSDQEKATFDGEIGSWWIGPWAVVLWAVPAVLLFVVLLATQRYLARRFHRRVNGWLAAASALLVGLCLGVAIVVSQAEHWLAVAS
ncbi:MAG TPA: hypothetical protein VGD84_22290, partial [Pseudonocardiaceae bacterium]